MAAKRKTNGTWQSAMRDLARTMDESQRESQRRTDEILRRMDERSARADERSAAADERMAKHEAELNEARRHSDEIHFELSKINAQIIKRLDRIEAVLEEHTKAFERLPDAIRERVGFVRAA